MRRGVSGPAQPALGARVRGGGGVGGGHSEQLL